jgi:hypothetical protein
MRRDLSGDGFSHSTARSQHQSVNADPGLDRRLINRSHLGCAKDFLGCFLRRLNVKEHRFILGHAPARSQTLRLSDQDILAHPVKVILCQIASGVALFQHLERVWPVNAKPRALHQERGEQERQTDHSAYHTRCITTCTPKYPSLQPADQSGQFIMTLSFVNEAKHATPIRERLDTDQAVVIALSISACGTGDPRSRAATA